MKNSNQINVPQAREAMDKFKMAAAQDVDGPVTYWTAIDLSQIIKSTDGFPKSIAALLLHLYKQIGVDLQYKPYSLCIYTKNMTFFLFCPAKTDS